MSCQLCFALDLVADAHLIGEYQRRHGPGAVWPNVLQALKAQGFEQMQIWRTGERLFMNAEVSEGYPRHLPPPLQAALAQWEAEMDCFQKPLPGAAGAKWAPMRLVFELSARPAA